MATVTGAAGGAFCASDWDPVRTAIAQLNKATRASVIGMKDPLTNKLPTAKTAESSVHDVCLQPSAKDLPPPIAESRQVSSDFPMRRRSSMIRMLSGSKAGTFNILYKQFIDFDNKELPRRISYNYLFSLLYR
ncbi:hypothetical protein PY650_01130 [Rhizobium calliandrae]|uniref:Uncharacterized protein n=1 Tax=Rhizobium calliandrae TaxID=1312182 RepID=A0ABT7K6P1_9HYPH|nr:hypothetical protein [Rhizobium calliandrae]MDL2404280.1 hypothetical protein [Rhizobium calliandrae]